MRNYRINNVTVERWAKLYSGPKFHALLSDPPYELGFMGKGWDKQGVAFHPDTWAGLAEHLHPGAFVMAFASSRGWHRLACAIEDAGLIIHPSIFGWAFGSGFPKATRIDTAIDKAAGATRETIPNPLAKQQTGQKNTAALQGDRSANSLLTIPATPAAQTWEGHRYGRQALKPALEPIIVAQKPYAGRPVDSIVTTGAGSLWIDGGRIGNELLNNRGMASLGVMHDDIWKPKTICNPVLGRWPANFYLSHHPDCNGVCHPDCPVKKLGQMSGESDSKESPRGGTSPNPNSWGKLRNDGHESAGINDTGTAARFFFNADWSHEVSERISNADPVFYQGKATRDERDLGLGHLETKAHAAYGEFKGTIDHPTNMNGEQHNPHPTVKPIALAEWLAKLLLPPSEYGPRRLLVPFAGSGSEIIGAYRAGWEFIEGVEMSREYTKIARARVNRWQSKGVQMSLFDEVA